MRRESAKTKGLAKHKVRMAKRAREQSTVAAEIGQIPKVKNTKKKKS